MITARRSWNLQHRQPLRRLLPAGRAAEPTPSSTEEPPAGRFRCRRRRVLQDRILLRTADPRIAVPARRTDDLRPGQSVMPSAYSVCVFQRTLVLAAGRRPERDLRGRSVARPGLPGHRPSCWSSLKCSRAARLRTHAALTRPARYRRPDDLHTTARTFVGSGIARAAAGSSEFDTNRGHRRRGPQYGSRRLHVFPVLIQPAFPLLRVQ